MVFITGGKEKDECLLIRLHIFRMQVCDNLQAFTESSRIMRKPQTIALDWSFLNLWLILKVPYKVVTQARETDVVGDLSLSLKLSWRTRKVSDFSLNGGTEKTAIPKESSCLRQ